MSMMERLAAGVLTAFAIPLAAALLRWAAEGESAVRLEEWRLLGLQALPLVLTLGTAISIVADRLAERLSQRPVPADGGPNPGQHRAGLYVTRLALYMLGGFGAAAGLANLAAAYHPGVPAGDMIPAVGLALGVPAAVLYFHVLLAVQAAAGWLHARKYAARIETERLVLEPCTYERYRAAQAEGYPMGSHVRIYMRELARHPRLLGWGVWFIRLKKTGELIGDAGFKGNPDAGGAVDLGYGLLAEHRGRGYATEAARALVDWAFAHGAQRITAETLPTNRASIRVLKKLGFTMYREDEHLHWKLDAFERAKMKRNGGAAERG